MVLFSLLHDIPLYEDTPIYLSIFFHPEMEGNWEILSSEVTFMYMYSQEGKGLFEWQPNTEMGRQASLKSTS